MIFLSAQPDEFYFSWQLEIQILNFVEKGILKRGNEMHILIGFNPLFGPNEKFIELQAKYSHFTNVKFFFYPDKRKRRNYQSSLRPNIIHQHFSLYTSLYNEFIFYHDSDILFLETIDFEPLLGDDIWYGSETGSYLNIDYISDYDSELVDQMAAIVGISRRDIEVADKNTIGAQYLLKRIPENFWKKIEEDSESIFDLLNNHNSKNEFKSSNGKWIVTKKDELIQDWCSDMWAILYNALFYNKNAAVSKLLDFCWAGTPVASENHYSILHYTGITSESPQYFKKGNYTFFPPLGAFHLEPLSPDYYGYFVSTYLKEIDRKEQFNFDILVDIHEIENEKINLLRNYYKNLGIKIFHKNESNTKYIKKDQLKITGYIIFNLEQLKNISIAFQKEGNFEMYFENTFLVNFLVKDVFNRCLQYDILENLNFLLNKSTPIKATTINEYDFVPKNIDSHIYIL